MAETSPTTTAAKEQLAKTNEARQASADKAVKMMEQSKPTPTQEENDLAKLGVDVVNKEDDGSGPDPSAPPTPEDKKPATPAPQSRSAPASKPTTGSGSTSS
jgi:hypothetical protein